MKEKVYKTMVKPAMLIGLEIVPLRKRQVVELDIAEMQAKVVFGSDQDVQDQK